MISELLKISKIIEIQFLKIMVTVSKLPYLHYNTALLGKAAFNIIIILSFTPYIINKNGPRK